MDKKESETSAIHPLKNIGDLENDDDTRSTKNLQHMQFRILKTIALFLSWIALGFFSEVLGPSLPALRILTSSNYEEVGRALAVRAGGLFIGSLIGGILSDLYSHRRDLLMFFFIAAGGVFTGILPLCTNLGSLCLLLFVHGVAHGGLTTSGNPLLNALWLAKSTGPFSFMHSGYGVGGSMAPFILKVFDTSNFTAISQVASTNVNQTKDPSVNNNITTLSYESAKYIQTPCLVISAYCIFVALIFLFYAFIGNPTDPHHHSNRLCSCCYGSESRKHVVTINGENDDKANSKLSFLSKIVTKRQILVKLKKFAKPFRNSRYFFIISFAFIGFFGIVGNERIFGKFQFSYATESQLNIPKQMAYWINGVYWICFTLGRIVTAFVAIKVSPRVLLIVEICGSLISSLVFTIFHSSFIVFFVFSGFFGLFKSPLFPTLLGVLSLYGPVTGSLTMVVNFGSSAGALICQYMMGFLIDKYGLYTFPFAVTITCLLLLILFSILLFVASRWQRNTTNNLTTEDGFESNEKLKM